MATSIFLARLIGPVMALVGVGVLANEAAFRKMAQEFLRSPAPDIFLRHDPAADRACSCTQPQCVESRTGQ